MKLGDLGGLHAALLACFLAALSARELILLSARAKKPAEVPARQTDNSISAEWGGALLPCCTTAAAGGVVGPPISTRWCIASRCSVLPTVRQALH